MAEDATSGTNPVVNQATNPATEPPAASVTQDLLSQLAKLLERLAKLGQGQGNCADIRNQIHQAQELVKANKVADAQAIYVKAAAATDRAEASLRSEPTAWRLLALETAYLMLILALGYLVKRYPDNWAWAGLVGLSAKAAWFGALGGVTIGIYGIYSHIAAKDFDASFRLWYICKPIVGAIFGWFVVLVYYVGLVSAQGQADVKTPQVTYAIAFLAGFSERFTIKTIDRLMTVLTGGDENDKNKNKSNGQAPAPTPKN